MKDETFMDWMRRNHPRMVKRAQRYATMTFVLGFAFGLYVGAGFQYFIAAIPQVIQQLSQPTPFYVVYVLVFACAFAGFAIGRAPRKARGK